MKIDIHNHFYPTRFLKHLEKDGSSVGISVETDAWDRQILAQRGTRVVTITPPMTNVDQRLEEMGQAGFDKQVLTLSIPSVDIFPIEIGETLATVVNDEFARISQDHPDHFTAFATLPFVDPDRAVR